MGFEYGICRHCYKKIKREKDWTGRWYHTNDFMYCGRHFGKIQSKEKETFAQPLTERELRHLKLKRIIKK
jgi:hypothetical protein